MTIGTYSERIGAKLVKKLKSAKKCPICNNFVEFSFISNLDKEKTIALLTITDNVIYKKRHIIISDNALILDNNGVVIVEQKLNKNHKCPRCGSLLISKSSYEEIPYIIFRSAYFRSIWSVASERMLNIKKQLTMRRFVDIMLEYSNEWGRLYLSEDYIAIKPEEVENIGYALSNYIATLFKPTDTDWKKIRYSPISVIKKAINGHSLNEIDLSHPYVIEHPNEILDLIGKKFYDKRNERNLKIYMIFLEAYSENIMPPYSLFCLPPANRGGGST